MHVKLYAKIMVVDKPDTPTVDMLNMIASQSRTRFPIGNEPRPDLFADTIKWGHDSIQEFVDYIFWIEGVSRTLLAQLTRHRIASYNVMSHRHVLPDECVLPEYVTEAKGIIEVFSEKIDEKLWIEWYVEDDGCFSYFCYNNSCEVVDLPDDIKLEDIRMLFPTAVVVNLFMKMNGRSLRNFIKLRTSEHAQWEIRELAKRIKEIVEEDCKELME